MKSESDDSEDTAPSSGSENESYSDKRNTAKIQFLTGMIGDLKTRAPHYLNDWQKPRSIGKVANAALFAFVIQLIPALIFAFLLDRQTDGKFACTEVLMSTGIIGVMYALLSGQPLTLLGVSGPVAILLGASHHLAEQFEADYFTFFWWTCIWTSILHVISAIFGLVNYAWYITPFTSQIFEFFVAISFLYQSISDLVNPIHLATVQTEEERSGAYASLLIGLLTFIICWKLHFAETWVYFTRQTRTFLATYNLLIVFVVMTGLSYLPGVAQSTDGAHGIERIHVDMSSWELPTLHPMSGIDAKGIFGALIPATMLYVLFFMDHNMSSAMAQAPKYNLKKPSAYHWDFFVLGLTMIPCGFLGLPPGCGLRPQAPLHTRALCTPVKTKTGFGAHREVVTHCEEQRWSAIFQASMMFYVLYLIKVISWIPVGCLFGALLYLGVSTMYSNSIWKRVSLMFMLPEKRPNIAIVAKISSWRTVQTYTAIQVMVGGVTYGVANFTEYGYIFPVLIAACVPLRSLVLNFMFSSDDMKYMDPEYETEEEYMQEYHKMQAAARRPSIDETDLFQGVSEFRRSHSVSVYDGDEYLSQKSSAELDADEVTTTKEHYRYDVDMENGSIRSLNKIPARNKTAVEPGFFSSLNLWANVVVPASDIWFGPVTDAEKDADELVIRQTRSARSTKSEIYDADDATVKSARTDMVDDLAIRSMRSAISELYDADAISIRSMRTGAFSSDDTSARSGRSSQGQSMWTRELKDLGKSMWTRELKDLGKIEKNLRKKKSLMFPLRSKRNVRKCSEVSPTRSDLEFDADRVIIPESILKSKSIAKKESSVMFAPDPKTREYDANKVRMPALKQSNSEYFDA
jgi:hypothetical protein